MKPAVMAIWFPSWFGRTAGWNKGSGTRSAALFNLRRRVSAPGVGRSADAARKVRAPLSFADLVEQVPLVLFANELDQLRIGNQFRVQFGFPRFGIGLRVVDGELDIHVPHVAPMNSLGQMHGVGRRDTASGQPLLPVETAGLDHQRVALPVADRISHPRRIGIRWKFAAVGKDLAEGVLIFVQNQDQSGSLDNLVYVKRIRFGYAARQAAGFGTVLLIVLLALVEQRLPQGVHGMSMPFK